MWLVRKEVDVVGLVETNIDWNQKDVWQTVKEYMGVVWKHVEMQLAGSEEKSDTIFQLGGLVTGVMGRWIGYVVEKGEDRWGRWSWIIMKGKGGSKWGVILVYQLCQRTMTVVGMLTVRLSSVSTEFSFFD